MNIIAGLLLFATAGQSQGEFSFEIAGKASMVTSQYDWHPRLAKVFKEGLLQGLGKDKEALDRRAHPEKFYQALIFSFEDFVLEELGETKGLKYLKTGDLGIFDAVKLGLRRAKYRALIEDRVARLTATEELEKLLPLPGQKPRK
jgi:hypothetical protein